MADFLDDAASANGIDADYMRRIMQIESGGNPSARTGSYSGLFQLSNSEFNRYGGGNIYSPVDNANAAARKMAAETSDFQDKYGRAPTPTELYMIHQQGAAGFAAHAANPDAPAWQNMASTGEGQQKGAGWARRAIWGNIPDSYKRQFGNVDNVTSQQFMDMWRNKVEGANPMPAGALSFASQPAALSGGGLDAINALRAQGRPPVADPNDPALSANFLTNGRGSLASRYAGLGAGSSDDIRNSLQTAAAYAMALDTKGASLGALPSKTGQYSLVPGPDGSVYQLDNRTGAVKVVAGPTPKIVQTGEDLLHGKQFQVQMGRQLLPISALSGGASGSTGGTGGGTPTSMQSLSDQITQARANGASPADLLNMVPAEVRGGVQAHLQGNDLPMSLSRGNAKDVVDLLTKAINPNFDPFTQPEKVGYAKQLGSESRTAAGGMLRSGIAALGNLYQAGNAIKDLGNYDLGSQWLTEGANIARGGNELAGKRDAATAAVRDYAGEANQLLTGGHPSVTGQAERQAVFGLHEAPQATASVLRQEARVLAERYQPIIDHIDNLYGPYAPQKAQEYRAQLTAAQKKVMDLADQMEGKSSVAGPGTPGAIGGGWTYNGTK